MWRKLLGLSAFLLYGLFGMFSGVAQAHEDSDPEDVEVEPVTKEVRCRVPGSTACVEACAAIDAFCAYRIVHPQKSGGERGDLYWCKGGWPTYTCSYKFADGDNCTLVYPGGFPLCLYQGGKNKGRAMTKDRELAEAISDGINCLAKLREISPTDALPHLECIQKLDALERALDAIRVGGVVDTPFVADEGLMAHLGAVRRLVSDWLAAGRSSPDLVPKIEVILARFGITMHDLDSPH